MKHNEQSHNRRDEQRDKQALFIDNDFFLLLSRIVYVAKVSNIDKKNKLFFVHEHFSLCNWYVWVANFIHFYWHFPNEKFLFLHSVFFYRMQNI